MDKASPPLSADEAIEGGLPTPESIMAAYHPHPIRLIELRINNTVMDAFPDDYRDQRYEIRDWFRFNHSTPLTPETKILSMGESSSLWRIQDNDTVVIGTYRLESNKHSIQEEQMAVAGDHISAQMTLGGIPFRFAIRTDSRASAFFGPYTLGSFSAELAVMEGLPVARMFSFEHESAFPMLTSDGIVYEHRNVRTNVTIRYWGLSTFEFARRGVEELSKDPSPLQWFIDHYPADFAPGGRFGQVSPVCGGVVHKSYDPCMNSWEIPVF